MESGALLHVTSRDFEKEVLQSEIPAVVDFYADWCGPCRMVSPVIEALSKQYSGKVKFVKLDTDANQDLAIKYQVMSIPTVMVFKRGQVIERFVGAAPASFYKQKIDAVLAA